MNSTTQARLLRQYAEFFRHAGDHDASSMHWGFRIGEGWAHLVEVVLMHMQGANEDWMAAQQTIGRFAVFCPPVHRVSLDAARALFSTCPKKPYDVEVVEVKEKFGSLRINIEGSALRAVEVVLETVTWLAERTCEECGKPSERQQRGGWWSTNCADCYKASKPEAGP